MAINAIEKEVLKLIGENVSSPDVFVDTEAGMEPIRDSINDAIAELCMVSGAYKQTYFLPLVAGQFIYPLTWSADDFGYVLQAMDRSRHMRLDQTDPLALGMTDFKWAESTGDPSHYYHIGYNHVGIYRTPTTSGAVIELECVCIPKRYTTGAELVKVRGNHQRACVFFAVSEFYASRGDAKRAVEWHTQYLEVADLMRLKPKATEQFKRMGGTN
jgi:hypothetical protein